MSGGEIYSQACTVDDPATYVAALSDSLLARLIGGLASAAGGIPALILGLCEVEAAKRWVAAQRDRSGAVGEGSC